MTTKMEQFIKFLKYCQREKKIIKDGADAAIARLDAWKCSFAKCKPSLQVERGLKESKLMMRSTWTISTTLTK